MDRAAWRAVVHMTEVNRHLIKGTSASQVALMINHPLANAGDVGDVGSIPGLGRSLGVGNGNPLQYSCLENSMDRGAWRAIVYGVAESSMTEWLSMNTRESLINRWKFFFSFYWGL